MYIYIYIGFGFRVLEHHSLRQWARQKRLGYMEMFHELEVRSLWGLYNKDCKVYLDPKSM